MQVTPVESAFDSQDCLAQVQARIPTFLAEAQAQVQVPQVQVGEISNVNSNVNSTNSPVVVS